jgi:hypothetical protein
MLLYVSIVALASGLLFYLMGRSRGASLAEGPLNSGEKRSG